jgi:hypothetical protein
LIIDTNYNVYSDARGGDPDSTSATLREYHKILWSKPLHNGNILELADNQKGVYLYHNSEIGQFTFGSDAITHSYKNQTRKAWITSQIPEEVDELFNTGSTIGAYIIFPNNRIAGNMTINQARGVNRLIDDRFDLTLECIRLFYLGQTSPLDGTLNRYKTFFELFDDFMDYVRFFLLDDLIDDSQSVKFYLPFDQFKTPPQFSSIDEYLCYKKGVMSFIRKRNERIREYASGLKDGLL